MAESIKRVLVSRGYALGDSVMCTCVLKPLHEKYPDAEIHYLSGFPEALGDFPYAKIMKQVEFPLDQYDKVFDLGTSLKIGTPLPYHAPLPHLSCAKCGVRFNNPEIYCEAIKTDFDVGIVPNTGRPNDTWSPEKFQELINKLNEMGFKCISFGPMHSPRFENCFNEYPFYNTNADSPDTNDHAYGAPKMCRHVHKSARIMKGLSVVVSGDTGLTHVAAAVFTPVVLLLPAGTLEQDFWLANMHSRIVHSDTNIVADTPVERVFNEVIRILFEKGRLVYS